jgi:CheY-like chemotaxis protein
MQKGISLARKILLADDSVTAQNMGRKILADAGYEVITVNNGSAALKKIAEFRPDLIVLDVYMPGYSGLEVCQRLKDAQETARIPVLLTVGKLEPFKAEEAQRVRAEGFIVKPFEASELLSALSKLEDKVVPRAEASKPGRYTRAAASGDGSSRGREASSDDVSWKERISFAGQRKKTEPEKEQKLQDEPAIYNPINRDLRAVIEKPAVEKEATPLAAAEAAVNFSAAVPQGLPKDVTPEELAAIAAAMAQMQGTMANTGQPEQPASEESRASAAGSSSVEEKVAPRGEAPDAPELETTAAMKAEAANQVKSESAQAESSMSSEKTVAEIAGVESSGTGQAAEEPEEVPATMAAAGMAAATSVPGPCWMAVPVTLVAEESAISLEQEMQKAYAAFAAAEANHPGFVEPGFVEPVPQAQAASENSVSPEAVPQPVAVPASQEPERTMSAAAAESAPTLAADAQPEAVDVAAPANPAEPAISLPDQASAATLPASAPEVERTETSLEAVSVSEFGHRDGQQPDTPPADLAVVAGSDAVAAPSAPKPLPVSESEPEVAHAIAPASAHVPVSEPTQPEQSNTVASTAAAWASWRQIRDAGDAAGKAAETATLPFEMNVPASTQAESAARAVAAGAEQIVREASVAAPRENPADVASIVESVLAELRPRLMEEISRKIAEKK